MSGAGGVKRKVWRLGDTVGLRVGTAYDEPPSEAGYYAKTEGHPWRRCDTYSAGDELIHRPTKVVKLTGFAWLWAKLTGKPTEWIEQREPVVYRCVDNGN